MPEKSFLGSVKDEINEQFAVAFDDLHEVTSDGDRLATVLKTIQKKVWEIVEKRLKESYRNGQKAKEQSGKPPTPADPPPETKRANPFRK